MFDTWLERENLLWRLLFDASTGCQHINLRHSKRIIIIIIIIMMSLSRRDSGDSEANLGLLGAIEGGSSSTVSLSEVELPLPADRAGAVHVGGDAAGESSGSSSSAAGAAAGAGAGHGSGAGAGGGGNQQATAIVGDIDEAALLKQQLADQQSLINDLLRHQQSTSSSPQHAQYSHSTASAELQAAADAATIAALPPVYASEAHDSSGAASATPDLQYAQMLQVRQCNSAQ